MDWLWTGEIGSSSKALCGAFLGKPATGSRPSDPDDLMRCRKFLARLSPTGKKQALEAISRKAVDWVPLVREWDYLCDLMDQEAPEWGKGSGRAPQTYHLMKLLEVEGYRLRYPDAEIRTYDDGTLHSLTNRKMSVVTLRGGTLTVETNG